MSATAESSGRVSYAAVLRAPGVAPPFFASLLGRLPMGALGLVLILDTRALTGSYAYGGLVAGVFALSFGVVSPLLGRAVDTRGQTRVLLAGASVQAGGLIAVASLPDGVGIAPLLALAAIIGAAEPPLSSCLRALWSHLLDDRHALFSMEAAVLEAVYIFGPVVIVAGIGSISLRAALLACAAFSLAGTVMFALTGASRSWRAMQSGPPRTRAGALGSTGIRTLLALMALMGVSIGTIEVAVPALCERSGSAGNAGLILGGWGLGSLVGGVISGRLGASALPQRRVARMLAALALLTLPLALASGLASLAPLIFIAGLFLAPALATANGLVDALAPTGTVTEAYTWLSTGIAAGIAAGSALGGTVVENAGPSTTFLLSASAVAAAAAVAFAGRSALAAP